MNNPENKSLKDYSHQELVSEITQRIENFSLSTDNLMVLMIIVGCQHLKWYEAERKKLNPKNE